MYKEFITQLYKQKEKNTPEAMTPAFGDSLNSLTRSKEVPLGDISLLPFHHSEFLEEFRLSDFIPIDLSMIREEALPHSPLLFTWTDPSMTALGFTKNLFWGIADLSGQTTKVYTGNALKTRFITRISTNLDIASVRFEQDGIHCAVRKDNTRKGQEQVFALTLFAGTMLYLLDALKVVCKEEPGYDADNDCYVFPIKPVERRSRKRTLSVAEMEQSIDVVGAL
ncbi:MAG: hypothetical protein IJU76_01535 [Desulfovibrionaceae bacterium]|nr:hypothetical protein [Desulfovibrionaceae bacterium]